MVGITLIQWVSNIAELGGSLDAENVCGAERGKFDGGASDLD